MSQIPLSSASIVFALACLMSCKSRPPHSRIREFSLQQDATRTKISGSIFVNADSFLPSKDQGSVGGGSIGGSHSPILSSAPQISPSPEELPKVRAELRTRLSAVLSASESEEKKSIYRGAAYEVRDQLKFAINQFQANGAAINFGSISIESISMDDLDIKPSDGTDPLLISVNYRAEATIMTDKGRTLPTSAIVPRVVESSFREILAKRFRKCLGHLQPEEAINYSQLFYYFEPSLCDIAAIEKEVGEHFVEVKITDSTRLTKDGGSPKYDQIWSDGVLTATLLFGTYSNDRPDDYGWKVYEDFVKKLRADPDLKFDKDWRNNVRNMTLTGQYKGRGNGRDKKRFDIQLIFLDSVSDLSQSIVRTLVGTERLKRNDLLNYNGHAGLGTNLAAVSNLFQPADGQYLVFFLNGCWSYSFVDVSQRKYDLVLNTEAALTDERGNSAHSMLKNLLRGSTYEKILGDLPKEHKPIVVHQESQESVCN